MLRMLMLIFSIVLNCWFNILLPDWIITLQNGITLMRFSKLITKELTYCMDMRTWKESSDFAKSCH